jgi:hypothetical protein
MQQLLRTFFIEERLAGCIKLHQNVGQHSLPRVTQVVLAWPEFSCSVTGRYCSVMSVTHQPAQTSLTQVCLIWAGARA